MGEHQVKWETMPQKQNKINKATKAVKEKKGEWEEENWRWDKLCIGMHTNMDTSKPKTHTQSHETWICNAALLQAGQTV